jgi:putative transposase
MGGRHHVHSLAQRVCLSGGCFGCIFAAVIGWDLDRTVEAELAIRALQMALRRRDWKAEELVHYSDRGVQYASGDYTDILEQGGIQISMSQRGNPV